MATEERRGRWPGGLPVSIAALLAFVCAAGLAASCSRSEELPAPSPSPPAASATPSLREVVDELFVDPEAEPDEGAPPLRVRFRPNVEDATGKVECEWDFGDGSARVKELRPTHVYETVGDYVAEVRCRDELGIEGEAEVDVFVEAEE